jgi:hypothetical protein
MPPLPSDPASDAAADLVPPAGPTLTIVAGDHQTATLMMTEHGFGMAQFQPISALLADGEGRPIPGKEVSWSVGETPGLMGVQLDPRGTSPCLVTTDAGGVATLAQMRGGSASAFYDHGPFTLVARCGTATAIATLEVNEPPLLIPTIISGDNQSVARSGSGPRGGEATFAPVKVRLAEASGAPVPGTPIAFEAIGTGSMSIRLDPGGLATIEVTTDADGIATLDRVGGASMVALGRTGEFKVVVTPPRTKSIMIHATVTD